MTTTSMIHCEFDNKVNMELGEVQDTGNGAYRTLNIGYSATIFMTEKQAEQLCEIMEKNLYDEPTYKQLNETCMELQMKVEELEEKLREQEEDNESAREHLSFQDVI
jgi:hypothetical protein